MEFVQHPKDNFYYIALVWDPNTGRLEKRASSSLVEHADCILREAVPRMRRCVTQACPHSMSQEQRLKSRCNLATESSEEANKEASSSNRRIETGQDDDVYRVCYEVAATHDWTAWFKHAFYAVQQKGCALIAKEWIKTIQPRKQREQPYNGKLPTTGKYVGPEALKPSYWPQDVLHKEPDHLLKEARVDSLVHLIMSTPYCPVSPTPSTRIVTAQTLGASLRSKKEDPRYRPVQDKFAVVDKIIEVRNVLEQYENGLGCRYSPNSS